jgi:sugar phosphate isomerase/epimerase
MVLSISELCLIGGEVEDNVDRLMEQGADNIELMLDGRGWDGFPRRMEALASMLKAKGVGYSVHVPVWDVNLTSENSHIRNAVLESYKDSILFAAMLEASHVVIHPGYRSDPHFSAATARSRARESLGELLDFNRQYGRLLLVENIGSPSASIFTQDEYATFLDDFPSELGYIVDIGHAFLNGWDIPALLDGIKERLFALHLHDNDGKRDAHLALGEGSIDWPRIFGAVKSTGRELELILEYNLGTDLSKLAKGKARLEAEFGV